MPLRTEDFLKCCFPGYILVARDMFYNISRRFAVEESMKIGLDGRVRKYYYLQLSYSLLLTHLPPPFPSSPLFRGRREVKMLKPLFPLWLGQLAPLAPMLDQWRENQTQEIQNKDSRMKKVVKPMNRKRRNPMSDLFWWQCFGFFIKELTNHNLNLTNQNTKISKEVVSKQTLLTVWK